MAVFTSTVIQRTLIGLASLMLVGGVACTTAAPAAPTAAPAGPTQAAAKPAAPTQAPAATAAAKPTAAPAAPAPTATPALTKVRYGLPTAPPSITTIGAYFALDNGFFKDEGLDVEIVPYPGAVTAVRALLSRDADIVMTGGDTAFLARASGAPIKIISSPVAKGTDSVVAARNVETFKDLSGKSYAIANPGDTSHVTAKLLAQKNGIEPDSIDFVAIGGPADRARALLSDKVSASTMTILILAPILEAIDKGDARVLTTLAKEFPDLPLAYNITGEDVIKDRGAMLQKFLKAEIKGYRWASQNPEQAATIAEKYIKEVPHDLMTRGMKGLVDLQVYGLDGGLTLEGVDRTQQLLVSLGAIKSPIKADEVTDTRFVDAAVKDLGPVQ